MMNSWTSMSLDGKYQTLVSYFTHRLEHGEIQVRNHQHLMEGLERAYTLTKNSGDERYIDNYAHNSGLLTISKTYTPNAESMSIDGIKHVADNVADMNSFIYWCKHQDWERAASYYESLYHVVISPVTMKHIVEDMSEVLIVRRKI